MFISKELDFINNFIEALDSSLKKIAPDKKLNAIQKKWLSFCILGIIVTNSLNWKQFERFSNGSRRHRSLSWMFRCSDICWSFLLRASIMVILSKYGITEGVLLVDTSEKLRAKITKRIYKAHKIKDKKTGGYFNGQSIVFLVLVTPVVTIPVGFQIHMPDPAIKAWEKEDAQLKKKGIPKKERPDKPARNKDFPTQQEIAIGLLEQFKKNFPHITIKCVLADAFYGDRQFMDKASTIYNNIQTISQLRKNQKIRYFGNQTNIETHFKKHPGSPYKVKVRGEEKTVIVSSARLYVYAHQKKRFIIAFKYEGEKEYRYLVATDLSWRTLDIIQAYTLRWLVEVFFEDWKSYEGWAQLAKQPDEEGSHRGLILSLLVDHCLFFHPEQSARLENKLPAFTVGSLREKIRAESLFEFIKELLESDNPQENLKLLIKNAEKVFQLNESKKHMVNRDIGQLQPAKSLNCRVRHVLKNNR